MLEITCNDRLGKKGRVKCFPDDTIGDLIKLIAAQNALGEDHVEEVHHFQGPYKAAGLSDEIHDGMNLELYYQ